MVLAGGGGTAQDWIELDELVSLTALEIVAHDQRLADDARSAFLRYGKGRHPAALHMGDCATYALAQSRKLPLLFKGGDFSKTDIESATAGP